MATYVTDQAREVMLTSVSGSDLYVALLNISTPTDPYTLKANYGNWDSLSAYEVTGTNYLAGGVLLSAISISADTVNNAYFDGSNIIWNNVTITAYGLAIYRRVSGLVIEIVLFDNAPLTSTNGPFTVSWTNQQILRAISG